MRSILFVFLLPLFFVFHGYVENFRFIDFSDCWLLFALYGAVTTIVFFLFRLLLKHPAKAALMTTFVMSFYFFFGALHDFFQKHGLVLHRYIFILPLFLLLACLLFFYLKRHVPDSKLSLFLNILLLIYLFTDAATLSWQHTQSSSRSFTAGMPGQLYSPCDSCAKPDIYFLLFDEYSGNYTLKNSYHYDNSDLDTFLIQQGFRVQAKSSSNYNFTPFSMLSILNSSYLTNIKDPLHITGYDYTAATAPDRKLEVVEYLMKEGYTIVNNSTFDLPEHPAFSEQPFFPLKTRLITHRTLSSYLEKDLGWWVLAHFQNQQIAAVKDHEHIRRLNQALIDNTIAETQKTTGAPRFVYMHVFLPHFPFLYDSLQHPRNMQSIIDEYGKPALHSYLDYIPYTNARLKEVISAIKNNTKGKAVIIFMSDHGYRHAEGIDTNKTALFNNQNALYFPDQDYHQLYDSISAVNEFRVVFNHLFRQNVPLLKDSAIHLKDDDGNGNSGL